MSKTMASIKAELDKQRIQYNSISALGEEKADFVKLNAINKEMEKNIDEYATLAKAAFLDALTSSKSPVTDAIKAPTYTVLHIKDTVDKDTKVVVRTIEDKTRTITFRDLNSKFESGFRNTNWKAYVEQLNLRLCLLTADKLGLPAAEKKEIEKRFRMSNGGRDIDLGATPTSNTQLLKQLITVCTSIDGEVEEATIKSMIRSHDVEFLVMAYTRMGRELRHISTLNSNKLADAILVIMNRAMLNENYGLDYQRTKEEAGHDTAKNAKSNSKSNSGKSKGNGKSGANKASKEDKTPAVEAKAEPAA